LLIGGARGEWQALGKGKKVALTDAVKAVIFYSYGKHLAKERIPLKDTQQPAIRHQETAVCALADAQHSRKEERGAGGNDEEQEKRVAHEEKKRVAYTGKTKSGTQGKRGARTTRKRKEEHDKQLGKHAARRQACGAQASMRRACRMLPCCKRENETETKREEDAPRKYSARLTPCKAALLTATTCSRTTLSSRMHAYLHTCTRAAPLTATTSQATIDGHHLLTSHN
jgi:hypothetical protein